jgi:HEPN domain-containing protein
MTSEDKAILRVNGKVVGTFPISGDDAVDALRAQETLSSIGHVASAPLDAIMRQAEAFEFSARALLATGDWRATSPIITNGCFSIELYLKSVLLSGRVTGWGHKLSDLYSKLTESQRGAAEALYRASRSDDGHFDGKTFEKVIEMLSCGFEEWRYLHEKTLTGVVSVRSVLLACSIVGELARKEQTA